MKCENIINKLARHTCENEKKIKELNKKLSVSGSSVIQSEVEKAVEITLQNILDRNIKTANTTILKNTT